MVAKSNAKKQEDIEEKVLEKDLEDKFEDIENQLKRAVADYRNLEKRTTEEKREWIKIANKDLILRLLTSLDYLDTAVKGAKEKGENSSWLQGVEMAVKGFQKTLEEEGLEEVEGGTFDPNIHEAIEVREGPGGTILDIFQVGYKLNGKLIRPAKVAVGNGETKSK